MALVDLVKIYASSTGSGAIALGGAVPGYRGREVLTSGQVYSYTIQQEADWEYGRGTWLPAQNAFVRAPLGSSSGGAALNLQPNASVAFVLLAEDLYELAGLSAPVDTNALANEVARATAAENFLSTRIVAAALGIVTYATVGAMNADTSRAVGTFALVTATDTFYRYTSGGWVVDEAFAAALAAFVQPLVDQAEVAAATAQAAALDSRANAVAARERVGGFFSTDRGTLGNDPITRPLLSVSGFVVALNDPSPIEQAGYSVDVYVGEVGDGTGSVILASPRGNDTRDYTVELLVPISGISTIGVRNVVLPPDTIIGLGWVVAWYGAAGGARIAYATGFTGECLAVETVPTDGFVLNFSVVPERLSIRAITGPLAVRLIGNPVVYNPLASIPENVIFDAVPVAERGRVTDASLWVAALGSGNFTIVAASRTGNTARIEATARLKATATGVQAFELPDSWPVIEAGWLLGVYTPTGGATIAYSETAGFDGQTIVAESVSPTTVIAAGVTFDNLVPSAPRVSMAFTLDVTTPAIDDRVSTNELALTALRPSPAALTDERFAGTVPSSDWSPGTWTWNNGLGSPATPSWAKTATYDLLSAAHRRAVRARFAVPDPANQFAVVFAAVAHDAFPKDCGSAFLVNGSTSRLHYYQLRADGTRTSLANAVIPFALGATMELHVEKNGMAITATLFDARTRASVALTVAYDAVGSYKGFDYGRAGVVCVSGAVTCTRFTYARRVRRLVHAMFWGDSIAQGYGAGASWATAPGYMVDAARGDDDVLIAAQSGERVEDALPRFGADLFPYSPNYVVIAYGANEQSQTTWRTGMTSLIAETLALGATPVLTTITPRTDSAPAQTLMNALNADILNGYFGQFDVIDYAAATSIGGDRVTLDPSKFVGDGLHPNATGYASMYAQLRIDAPYLIDDPVGR